MIDAARVIKRCRRRVEHEARAPSPPSTEGDMLPRKWLCKAFSRSERRWPQCGCAEALPRRAVSGPLPWKAASRFSAVRLPKKEILLRKPNRPAPQGLPYLETPVRKSSLYPANNVH